MCVLKSRRSTRTLLTIGCLAGTLLSSQPVFADAGSLPADATLKGIARQSQKTIETTYQNTGMSGVMNAVRGCYGKISARSAPNDRAKCIMLDIAAYRFEQSQPDDLRSADLQMDDYLSKANFFKRVDQYVPPLSHDAASRPQRVDNFTAIMKAYTEK